MNYSNDKTQNDEHYPIECPSRNNKSEQSPIVDNAVDNEVFPMRLTRKNSGVQSPYSNITEVVTTEIGADSESQTTHEQHK